MSRPTALPTFRYHPDPLRTGAIVASTATCECCGEARGFQYAPSFTATPDIAIVCPWCIANGKLAADFDVLLSDDHPLAEAGVPAAVIDEVTRRTPGYISWQQDSWLACCGDACEFQGDAPAAELRALDAAGLERLAADSGFTLDDLPDILVDYTPGGSPAFYKFVCRHCRAARFRGDCD